MGRRRLERRLDVRHHLETSAPVHHDGRMRLTINLDDEAYALAKSLARAEDSTISAAVNKLIRRGLEHKPPAMRRAKSGLPVVRCERKFTSEEVYALDQESA